MGILKSFKNAFSGIASAVRSERNLRIHLSIAFYVLVAADVTRAEIVEWCVLALCIGLVLAAELVNTAVERLCDKICTEQSADVGFIKNVSAGAVLILAILSAVAGGFIFFSADKLKTAVEFFRSYPVLVCLIAATVPAAFIFTFGRANDDK